MDAGDSLARRPSGQAIECLVSEILVEFTNALKCVFKKLPILNLIRDSKSNHRGGGEPIETRFTCRMEYARRAWGGGLQFF